MKNYLGVARSCLITVSLVIAAALISVGLLTAPQLEYEGQSSSNSESQKSTSYQDWSKKQGKI